eukprot:6913386-Alexandrium_andersonii.AAC.1
MVLGAVACGQPQDELALPGSIGSKTAKATATHQLPMRLWQRKRHRTKQRLNEPSDAMPDASGLDDSDGSDSQDG